MRLFKRGKVWFCWFYVEGQRVKRSTRCHDREAAKVVAAQWERDGADPDYAVSRKTTLAQAVAAFLADIEENVEAGNKSSGTLNFHRTKIGHWVGVLGADFPLARLSPAVVDEYISTRRKDTVDKDGTKRIGEYTISKELISLRKMLKLAKRRGLWRGDIQAIVPVAFDSKYKPRKRWLPPEELIKLLGQLTSDHAARVAFIVATSANWKETELARREDVTKKMVLIRGTKTDTRFRPVPMMSQWGQQLIKMALEHAQGERGMMFQPWSSVRKGLIAACERAGIEPCTPNDLRRSFGKWMRADRVPLELIAPAMGHKDTTMLQRVYGRLDGDELGDRLSDYWDTGGTKKSGKKQKMTTMRIPELKNINVLKGKRESGRNRTVNLRIKSPILLLPKPLEQYANQPKHKQSGTRAGQKFSPRIVKGGKR